MKKLITLFLGLVLAIASYAVPATPRPINVVQPDGDTLTIRLRGDEHHHWRTTLDGIEIVQNDKGYYCYAIKDKQGQITAGKKVAHNEDKRTRCEKRYINKILKKYFTNKN